MGHTCGELNEIELSPSRWRCTGCDAYWRAKSLSQTAEDTTRCGKPSVTNQILYAGLYTKTVSASGSE